MDYRHFFVELVSYFLVPLGILCISWVIQVQFSMRQNAAIDIFSFTAALDLSFLVVHSSETSRLNSHFHDIASAVFACSLLASLFFLGYSIYTQSLINKQLRQRTQYYPAKKVWVCWTAGLTAIGFHVWAILGG